MIGTTLEDIRTHIEALASEDGSYYLICARYGDRPVPTAGLRFETRTKARVAARATEQYRAALRRYDPRLPHYDVIVCEDVPATYSHGDTEAETAEQNEKREIDAHEPDVASAESFAPGLGGTKCDRSRRAEFCHRVAAAVFEALSAAGHDEVESAVMEVYFELAESVPDLDDLCLCLLESMATEIDQRLSAAEQAQLINAAVDRLPGPESTDHPVAATLASLDRCEVIAGYSWSPSVETDDSNGRGVVLRVRDYALSPRVDELPVLPIVVELARHQPAMRLSSVGVTEIDDGWQLSLEFAQNATPDDLVSARIRSEA
jgi:phage baseplate assembly protein W